MLHGDRATAPVPASLAPRRRGHGRVRFGERRSRTWSWRGADGGTATVRGRGAREGGGAMSLRNPQLKALRGHRVPGWWLDAKLGIFVHWTPASVPAFAPVDA